VQYVPPVAGEIKLFLDEYKDIFASQVGFHIRPYRYAPNLKDEIEAQVKQMLEACLIQHSSSSFSSPMLLVKKKDETYRFYVDYRHLNAITVKGQITGMSSMSSWMSFNRHVGLQLLTCVLVFIKFRWIFLTVLRQHFKLMWATMSSRLCRLD
jgi:hypothetical protein